MKNQSWIGFEDGSHRGSADLAWRGGASWKLQNQFEYKSPFKIWIRSQTSQQVTGYLATNSHLTIDWPPEGWSRYCSLQSYRNGGGSLYSRAPPPRMRIGAFVGCFGIFVCIVVVFSWPMRMGPHLHRIHIQLTVAHCLHVWSSFWSQRIVLQPERSMAAKTQRFLVDTVKGKPHAPQQLVWLVLLSLLHNISKEDSSMLVIVWVM